MSRFLVYIPVACLFFLTATCVFAQHVEFGIKTGVPHTDIMQTAFGGFDAQTKGYTVGPVMNIHIPGPLSVEIGTMYKRIDQQGPVVTILGYTCLECEEGPVAIRTIQSTSKAGHSWEFPVAVQYHVPFRSLRPYVEGGISFNRLSDVLAPYQPPNPLVFPLGNPPVGAVLGPSVTSISRTGFLAGGGVDIKLPTGHLTPGVRYTRYGEERGSFFPSTNAVDFLLGFQLLKF
jgi:hypothetical protein